MCHGLERESRRSCGCWSQLSRKAKAAGVAKRELEHVTRDLCTLLQRVECLLASPIDIGIGLGSDAVTTTSANGASRASVGNFYSSDTLNVFYNLIPHLVLRSTWCSLVATWLP